MANPAPKRDPQREAGEWLDRDRKYQTLCPICEPGWGVPVDEDGCCTTCGAPAFGDGVDTVAAALREAREESIEHQQLAAKAIKALDASVQRNDKLREECERLRRYHRRDCNALLDDASDIDALTDAQQCTCPAWWEELRQTEAALKEADKRLSDPSGDLKIIVMEALHIVRRARAEEPK